MITKTKMGIFLAILLVISVFATVPVMSFERQETDIVLIRTSNSYEITNLEALGAKVIEVYDNHILVEVDLSVVPQIEKMGLTIDRLGRRTTIYVNDYVFDFTKGEPQMPEELTVHEYQPRVKGQYIVHMKGPVARNWRPTLEGMGVEVMCYIPNYAYRVRMKPEIVGRISELYFVDWVGIYHPYYKIQPGLSPGMVEIGLVPGASSESLNAVGQYATVTGVEQFQNGEYFLTAFADTTNTLHELGRIDDILYIMERTEMQLQCEMSTQIIGGGLWFFDDDNDPTTAYRAHGDYGSYMNQIGYTGEGVVIAVADTGLGGGTVGNQHADFQDRVIGGYSYQGGWEDGHGHGTHCAGSAAGHTHGGTGTTVYNNYYAAEGLAPSAELYAVRIFGGSGGGTWIGPSDIYHIVQIAKENADAYVHTNSWGSIEATGIYDSRSSRYDAAARGEDMVLVCAAGNSGPGRTTIIRPGTGKNVITVGATNTYNPGGTPSTNNPEYMASFSSRGWTADNRIKPDIIAPGRGIFSTRPLSGYVYMSGTSMATPAAAGAAAVIVEWYEVNHIDNERPSPAMVKALMINTANQIDGDTEGPIPNRDEGWGMVDISKLERPFGEPVPFFLYDQESIFTESLQVEEHLIMVDRDNEPLKLSLVWTDKEAPSGTGSGRTLINDLNLEVESPGGLVYRGNAFSGGWTQEGADSMSIFDYSGDGWDDTNNVENIYIHPDELEPGVYIVRVEARTITEDAVGVGYNSQDYALIAYNAKEEIPGDPPVVEVTRPNGGEVFTARTDEDITWTALPGDDPIYFIQLSYSINAGASWRIIDTGLPNTGVYTWNIPNVNSDQCLVRVRAIDEMGRSGQNVSDDVFEIIGLPPTPPANIEVQHASAPHMAVFDDFADGDYDGWTVFDGTWDASQGYLQGHGSISIPAEMNGENIGAYGRWEFDFQLTETSDAAGYQLMRNHFIQIDNPDSRYASGYYVIVTGDIPNGGQINLWRWDNGDTPPEATINSNWAPNTNVNTVAVEREENGAFSMYLNGNLLGVGTDNTYTINEYMGFRHNSNPSGGDDHIIHEIRVAVMGDEDEHNLLTWNPSPDESLDEVMHYNIYRTEFQSGPWDGSTLIDSIPVDGSPEYSFLDLGKGMLDDIYWWYVVRAVGTNGLEEMNINAVQEPGEPVTFEFDVTVDDIIAGEYPTIVISDATDEGVPLDGIYSVDIHIHGNDITADMNFDDGYAVYAWAALALTTADDYTAYATIDGATRSDNFAVQPGETDQLVITPATATITAGDTQAYTAMAYDEYDNEIGDITADTDWSINTGAGGSWAGNVYTSEFADVWTVTGEYGEANGTAILTVEAGAAVSFVILPGISQISAGETQVYTGSTADEFGNLIDDVTDSTDWSIEAGAGGSWTDNIYTSEYAGEWTVTGEYGALTFDATLTVGPADVHTVTISPSTAQTVEAGVNLPFTAEAWDEYENLITDTVADFTWQNTNADGVFNQEIVGNYSVAATYDGVPSYPITVTVIPAGVTNVTIMPSQPRTVNAGQNLTFTAEARDEYGNLITDMATEFTWNNANTNGVFNGEQAGNYLVSATYGEITSDTTTVTVVPASVANVTISPSTSQSVVAGTNLAFTAQARDRYGNLITDTVTNFTWDNANASGVFNEETVDEYQITANYGGVTSDPTTVTVIPAGVATVTISPSTAQTVYTGKNLAFTAQARDQYGNLITDTATDFTWTNASPEGVFNKDSAGEYEVTAAYGGITSAATLVTAETDSWIELPHGNTCWISLLILIFIIIIIIFVMIKKRKNPEVPPFEEEPGTIQDDTPPPPPTEEPGAMPVDNSPPPE